MRVGGEANISQASGKIYSGIPVHLVIRCLRTALLVAQNLKMLSINIDHSASLSDYPQRSWVHCRLPSCWRSASSRASRKRRATGTLSAHGGTYTCIILGVVGEMERAEVENGEGCGGSGRRQGGEHGVLTRETGGLANQIEGIGGGSLA